MKTRKEIKAIAKQAMKKQRGSCILILFIVGLITAVSGLLGAIPFIGWLIAIAVSILIIVLGVNICAFFYNVYEDRLVSVGDPFNQLGVNFLRKLGGTLWQSLWLFLWMLLIIPGFVKSYAYSMTPYILACHPNVPATEALKLSMRMTKGYKGRLFLLDLSWIGWFLLSSLTLWILALVHVVPYMATTHAGFFIELRDQAIANGVINPEELGIETPATPTQTI